MIRNVHVVTPVRYESHDFIIKRLLRHGTSHVPVLIIFDPTIEHVRFYFDRIPKRPPVFTRGDHVE